jgi:NAD(P)-dependent dehydrogenase (short-subunit alcohol dehydrogenase family)
MQVQNRVFVVTGGGNGIGREVVLGLLARGARVAAVDLSASGLAETAQLARTRASSASQPEPTNGALSTHTVSVADRVAVELLPAEVIEVHGQVDGVLNVAGIVQRFAKVPDLDFKDMKRVMDVNFWGVLNVTKAFLPLLLQRPAASLVNVSSMGALVPVPGQSIYGASKAAVKLLTEGLYAELRGSSVAVTVVFSGGVSTDIVAHSGVVMKRTPADAVQSGAKLTTAPDAARQIIEAVEKGTFRVRIGGDARLLDRLARLTPQRAILLIAHQMKALLD